ncbi:GCK domain-containing protein [Perilla frutescens var. hirtella]|nr:GCK domain-containing protein [Perilla frutescens var. hirtella]KAH6805307.1 GCK domain-containing protein [Perilla frutescens var. frutescens]
MGDYLSTLSQSNPSSTESGRTMAPPNSSEAHQPKPESEPANQPETPNRESPDPPKPEKAEKVPEDSTEEGNGGEGGKVKDEEEEEGECGFCLFMKAGGCRETFTDWEKCVEEGEKNKEDIVEKCFQATSALRKCMEAHPDYYAPLLEAEEAAVKQLEAEKERPSDQATAGEESGKKGEEQKLDDSDKKVTS